MKHLKTYNESIRHLLKPKSEEHILKLLEDESLEEKFRILTLNHLYDLAKEFADKIKDYFYIYQTFLDGLVRNRTVVRFNDEEVDLIKKQIKVDNNNMNYARFNMIEGDDPIRSKFTSLFISDGYSYYYINNYNHFITVKHINNHRQLKFNYICPTIKHLIKFLDDYMIMCSVIY